MKKPLEGKRLDFILSITPEDIHKDFLRDLFSATEKSDAKYKPNEKFRLPYSRFESKYKIGNFSKGYVVTTIGRYIFNLVINPIGDPFIYKNLGYQNDVFDKSGVKKLENKLNNLLLEDKITTKQYIRYIDRRDFIGYGSSNLFQVTLNFNLVAPNPAVMQRKEELFKKYEKEIEEGNVLVISRIEKELLELAKKKVGNEEGMAIYDSGSRGSFSNNYKNSAIMRGAIEKLNGDIVISKSSLSEGIPMEELSAYKDVLVNGGYARGKETQQGGYMAKQLSASFQSMVLGEPDSDCRTKKTIPVTLTSKNKKGYLLRYIVERGKLVLLDNDNIDSYIGKSVNMRSPMYCTNENMCSKCAGELYFRLELKNMGLTFNRVGTRILNLSLKQVHDQTKSTKSINIFDYIS